MIFGLIYIVEKAKRVLDFIGTVFIFHIVFCLWYNGFVLFKFSWWVIHGFCFLVTVFLGEYVCMKCEQQEIKLVENLFSSKKPKKKKVEGPQESKRDLKKVTKVKKSEINQEIELRDIKIKVHTKSEKQA
jgi:hypothetical protein